MTVRAVHRTDDDAVVCFSKRTSDEGSDDTVIVVANVDPHAARETLIHLDLPALGLTSRDRFLATDEITGQTWSWGERNYVRLDPFDVPAHIVSIRRTGA